MGARLKKKIDLCVKRSLPLSFRYNTVYSFVEDSNRRANCSEKGEHTFFDVRINEESKCCYAVRWFASFAAWVNSVVPRALCRSVPAI